MKVGVNAGAGAPPPKVGGTNGVDEPGANGIVGPKIGFIVNPPLPPPDELPPPPDVQALVVNVASLLYTVTVVFVTYDLK